MAEAQVDPERDRVALSDPGADPEAVDPIPREVDPIPREVEEEGPTLAMKPATAEEEPMTVLNFVVQWQKVCFSSLLPADPLVGICTIILVSKYQCSTFRGVALTVTE